MMQKEITMDLPLKGLKVVDISQGIAGPHCGMLLALYGAEVVKIEPPRGDWIRGIGVRYGTQTALSASYNRGKKSVVLDLKQPAALDVAHRMAREADIFIENFRPGAVARLGLGYDAVAKENPGIVYVSISGFGQEGPYRDQPCTDTVAQAFSGMMSVNRSSDDEPIKTGAFLIDLLTGLYSFQAVSMALLGRGGSGAGRYLDISLMQTTAAVLAPNILEHYLAGGPPRLPNVPGGVFPTKDGWVLVTLLQEEKYNQICRVLGVPELADDPRFDSFDSRATNKDILLPLLREAYRKETTAVWVERMKEVDVLCSPVLSPLDWLDDPHVQAVNAAPMITQPGVGTVPVPSIPGAAPCREGDPLYRLPEVGEHTREILEGMGLTAQDIDALCGSEAAD